MSLKLITAPAAEPLSLVEARAHLRLTATESPPEHPDDTLVSSLILAVRQHLDGADGILGRALVTQTWELVLDAFPDGGGAIRLPLPPLQRVDSVKYLDGDGSEQTLPASGYDVDADSQPGWVVPGEAGWPETFDGINTVRIRFTCGYGGAAAVPAPVKAAILLKVGHLYEHREEVVTGTIATELPGAAKALLAPYRVWL